MDITLSSKQGFQVVRILRKSNAKFAKNVKLGDIITIETSVDSDFNYKSVPHFNILVNGKVTGELSQGNFSTLMDIQIPKHPSHNFENHKVFLVQPIDL